MLVVLRCKFKFSLEVKPDPIAFAFTLDLIEETEKKKSKQIRSLSQVPDPIAQPARSFLFFFRSDRS
jgi:hypothetical protein